MIESFLQEETIPPAPVNLVFSIGMFVYCRRPTFELFNLHFMFCIIAFGTTKNNIFISITDVAIKSVHHFTCTTLICKRAIAIIAIALSSFNYPSVKNGLIMMKLPYIQHQDMHYCCLQQDRGPPQENH